MSGEIRPFPGVLDVGRPADAQPQPAVIELLTDLLSRAERGDIQAVAVTGVLPNRNVFDCWKLGPNCTHQLVAGVTYLQNRLATAANECDQAEAPPPPGG